MTGLQGSVIEPENKASCFEVVVQGSTVPLNFLDSGAFALALYSVIPIMVIETHECEIVDICVVGIVIEMSYLAVFLRDIPVQSEAEATPPTACYKHGGRDVLWDLFPFLHFLHVLAELLIM